MNRYRAVFIRLKMKFVRLPGASWAFAGGAAVNSIDVRGESMQNAFAEFSGDPSAAEAV